MQNPGQTQIFYKVGQTQLTQSKHDPVDSDDPDDLTQLQHCCSPNNLLISSFISTKHTYVSISPTYVPYSLKFSWTKIFVVCQICLEKVIFVIKISWMHSRRTRSFKSLVARPLFSIFICGRKSGLRETIVANRYKYLIEMSTRYKLFVDIMRLKITYNL